MSFQDKLTAIMQKPGQDPNAKDDAPWYLKYGGRIVGTFGGFISILVGAIGCLGIILFSVWSFLSGICMMLIGFLVIVVEAPCCCMFIEFVQKISNIADSRPYWNRAALYCGLPIIPLVMNLTITTFFACALIFCTGLIYGVMAIGKKGGDLADGGGLPTSYVSSPTGEQMPQQGDHHTTLMEDPDVWRPT
ncbi:calcium channel flower isoform X2 [Phymastichus coffea]|uniref:calcium channel flower isoform X2 n=1 Tax=Phymastichus coffea TaxID=108790 RepID=UPI00273CC828|nr:calcium channel flower isoform X2 [Phymastichus coffea]